MKRISLILLLTAAISFAGRAQDAKPATGHEGHSHDTPTITATPASNADNPNAPEISFETETIDYGTIKQGEEGTRIFKFKNTGKEPLVISNARGSCGCTVPTWPKEPLMKGQTAELKVHYDTKRVGAFTKTVTVESNAKTSSKVVTIKGTVEADETADQTMPLRKTDGAPLEIKNK
jgi:hypothetical protein